MTRGLQARICNLQYFAGKANELSLLRDRVAELEDLLGLRPDQRASFIVFLRFTPGEAAFCSTVYARNGVSSRDHIISALYGSLADCDQPEMKLVDVWAFKVRRKLKVFDIHLSLAWGIGYFFDQENRDKLAALLRERGRGLQV